MRASPQRLANHPGPQTLHEVTKVELISEEFMYLG
jgi:hypothetical protein